MTVWKFQLAVTDTQFVALPEDASPLSVQAQEGTPCLWALCDPGKPSVERKFITVGTGHTIPPQTGDYIGTYQLHGGAFVGHVFESAA